METDLAGPIDHSDSSSNESWTFVDDIDPSEVRYSNSETEDVNPSEKNDSESDGISVIDENEYIHELNYLNEIHRCDDDDRKKLYNERRLILENLILGNAKTSRGACPLKQFCTWPTFIGLAIVFLSFMIAQHLTNQLIKENKTEPLDISLDTASDESNIDPLVYCKEINSGYLDGSYQSNIQREKVITKCIKNFQRKYDKSKQAVIDEIIAENRKMERKYKNPHIKDKKIKYQTNENNTKNNDLPTYKELLELKEKLQRKEKQLIEKEKQLLKKEAELNKRTNQDKYKREKLKGDMKFKQCKANYSEKKKAPRKNDDNWYLKTAQLRENARKYPSDLYFNVGRSKDSLRKKVKNWWFDRAQYRQYQRFGEFW